MWLRARQVMKIEALEHALAEAMAQRLTSDPETVQCRLLAYEAALEGFQLGIVVTSQFLAERAVKEDSDLLQEVEEQLRALPRGPAHPRRVEGAERRDRHPERRVPLTVQPVETGAGAGRSLALVQPQLGQLGPAWRRAMGGARGP